MFLWVLLHYTVGAVVDMVPLYAVVSDAVAVGAVVFVLLMIVPLLAGSAVAACAVSYMVK